MVLAAAAVARGPLDRAVEQGLAERAAAPAQLEQGVAGAPLAPAVTPGREGRLAAEVTPVRVVARVVVAQVAVARAAARVAAARVSPRPTSCSCLRSPSQVPWEVCWAQTRRAK